MLNEQFREEMPLSPLNPQIWKGWNQTPISPIYSRLIFEEGTLILRQINGMENPIPPEQPYFIDLQLLHNYSPKLPKKRRKGHPKDRWQTHLPGSTSYTPMPESPESPYKRTVFKGIPPQLSFSLKDRSGNIIGTITQGDKLRSAGITNVETYNEGFTTSYNSQKIVLITQSFIQNEYTIFFLDDQNKLQQATRKLL